MGGKESLSSSQLCCRTLHPSLDPEALLMPWARHCCVNPLRKGGEQS